MAEVIVFDADNTLWDTNAVFYNAQVDMLSVLASAGMLDEPDEQINNLRALDRKLMKQMGRNEYDFRVLAEALIHFYSDGRDRESTIDTVLKEINRRESYSALAEEAYEQFSNTLKNIPSLFPGVIATLQRINQHEDVFTVLFSEGDKKRLFRILDNDSSVSAAYFDRVSIVPKKDVVAFQNLRKTVDSKLEDTINNHIMVGDSISSDIRPANKAGFVSVHKPGDFAKHEVSEEPADQPDFMIKSLVDLLEIIEEIRRTKKAH